MMWINVHGKGFAIDEGVLGYIERRLRFALGRFGDLIGRVTVLIDADGPRAEHENSVGWWSTFWATPGSSSRTPTAA